MGIVMRNAVLVDDICKNSLVGEAALVGVPVRGVGSTVVDRILGVEQIATRKALLITSLELSTRVTVGGDISANGPRARRQFARVYMVVASAFP